MSLSKCAMCGSDALLLGFGRCLGPGCKITGPLEDPDGSQWNYMQRLIAAGLNAEAAAKATQVRTLSEQVENGIGTVLKAVVNKLEEAHRRLDVADVRLTAQDKRVTALEAWRETHTETTDPPKPEPYIPYRDEVHAPPESFTGGPNDVRYQAEHEGKNWYCLHDLPISHVCMVGTTWPIRDSEGNAICVEDLRERPTSEPIPPTRTGWQPCTETPKDGEMIWLESNIGYFQYHAPVWDQYCQFKPEHTRWIPLAEVLAAIEAAEVPALERRMDERFLNWTAKRSEDGYWTLQDGKQWLVKTDHNSYAAAMRAALGYT